MRKYRILEYPKGYFRPMQYRNQWGWYLGGEKKYGNGDEYWGWYFFEDKKGEQAVFRLIEDAEDHIMRYHMGYTWPTLQPGMVVKEIELEDYDAHA